MQGEPSRWSPGAAGAVTQAEGCRPDSEELAFILSLKAGKAASPVRREAIRRGLSYWGGQWSVLLRPATHWTRPTCSGRPPADSAYLLKCSSPLRTPSKTKPECPTQHLGPSQPGRLTYSVNIPEGSTDGLGTRPQVDRGPEAYAPNCQMLPPPTWNEHPSCPGEG